MFQILDADFAANGLNMNTCAHGVWKPSLSQPLVSWCCRSGVVTAAEPSLIDVTLQCWLPWVVTGFWMLLFLTCFQTEKLGIQHSWNPSAWGIGEVLAAQLSEIGSILFIKAHGQELPLSSRDGLWGPMSRAGWEEQRGERRSNQLPLKLVPASGFTGPFLQGLCRNTNRGSCFVHLNRVIDKLTNAR